MKKLFGAGIVLAFSFAANAQTAKPHVVRLSPMATTYTGVQWSWTAPTTGTPAQAYNLYQAPGSCPASGIPAGGAVIALGDTLTSYLQTPIPAGVTCTWVTAVSAVGVEGPPSLPFQLDTTAPGAPGKPSAALQ